MMGRTAEWSTHSKEARLLSESEVRYVKSQGISLGGHTLTHPRLTLLNNDELERQLVASRTALIDLGERFHAFAYPFGEGREREVAAVKSAGYECAVTVNGTIDPTNADLFRLGRLLVDRSVDLPSFKRMFPRPRPLKDWIARRARSLAHTLRGRLPGASKSAGRRTKPTR
jgi:peptidoglycan/xylan/chitin deacetylase (PgdA/CDA1 family)